VEEGTEETAEVDEKDGETC